MTTMAKLTLGDNRLLCCECWGDDIWGIAVQSTDSTVDKPCDNCGVVCRHRFEAPKQKDETRMTTNVMIDIETLGTGHLPVILSIGACVFTLPDPQATDPTSREYTGFVGSDYFDVTMDPIAGQKLGWNIDASTVMWWLQQSEHSRAQFKDSSRPLLQPQVVLKEFAWWLRQVTNEPLIVWSKPASFDLLILRNAFEFLGIELPWRFRDERCVRTFLADRPEAEKKEVGHVALDDAIAQASTMIEVERKRLGR